LPPFTETCSKNDEKIAGALLPIGIRQMHHNTGEGKNFTHAKEETSEKLPFFK
jgi:hypothetical protein